MPDNNIDRLVNDHVIDRSHNRWKARRCHMLIELKKAGRRYHMGQGEIWALKDVTWSIPEGLLVTILGPSGSGKSTLLNIMGGIDRADAGTVRGAGVDLSHASEGDLTQFRRDTVGFVFQFFNLIPNLTVRENVEVTADNATKPLPIDEVLQAVTLSSMACLLYTSDAADDLLCVDL